MASTQDSRGNLGAAGVSQNGDDDPRLQEYEKPGVRFDMLVRADYFAGMFGHKARMERGMQFCEKVLAKHPQHPEALVWHGGGLLSRAALAYEKGDSALGGQLFPARTQGNGRRETLRAGKHRCEDRPGAHANRHITVRLRPGRSTRAPITGERGERLRASASQAAASFPQLGYA
jgi:hypothetical protein